MCARRELTIDKEVSFRGAIILTYIVQVSKLQGLCISPLALNSVQDQDVHDLTSGHREVQSGHGCQHKLHGALAVADLPYGASQFLASATDTAKSAGSGIFIQFFCLTCPTSSRYSPERLGLARPLVLLRA